MSLMSSFLGHGVCIRDTLSLLHLTYVKSSVYILYGTQRCRKAVNGTRNPAKASGGRPYETGSRNMAATKKMYFLTLVSYSLLQTLFG